MSGDHDQVLAPSSELGDIDYEARTERVAYAREYYRQGHNLVILSAGLRGPFNETSRQSSNESVAIAPSKKRKRISKPQVIGDYYQATRPRSTRAAKAQKAVTAIRHDRGAGIDAREEEAKRTQASWDRSYMETVDRPKRVKPTARKIDFTGYDSQVPSRLQLRAHDRVRPAGETSAAYVADALQGRARLEDSPFVECDLAEAPIDVENKARADVVADTERIDEDPNVVATARLDDGQRASVAIVEERSEEQPRSDGSVAVADKTDLGVAADASRIDETRFENRALVATAALPAVDAPQTAVLSSSAMTAICASDVVLRSSGELLTASRGVDSSVQTRATSSILLSARMDLAQAVQFDFSDADLLTRPSPSPIKAPHIDRPASQIVAQSTVKPAASDILAPTQTSGMHTPRPSPRARGRPDTSPVGASTPLAQAIAGGRNLFSAFESPVRVDNSPISFGGRIDVSASTPRSPSVGAPNLKGLPSSGVLSCRSTIHTDLDRATAWLNQTTFDVGREARRLMESQE